MGSAQKKMSAQPRRLCRPPRRVVPHRGLCAPGFRSLCRAVFGVGGAPFRCRAAQPRKVGLGVAVGLLRPVKAACAGLAGYVGKPRHASDWPARHLAGCERRPILRGQREPRERTWAPCRRRRAGCWRPRDWTAVSINIPSSLVTSFYRFIETVVAVAHSPGQTHVFWRYLRLEAVSPPTQLQ
jgi:hypothetical protein